MAQLSQYAKHMLTLTVWREMRGTPRAWRMVIWTILNRANMRWEGRPLWWGGDVVSVVTHPFQFSSMSAPGDPNLRVWPKENDPEWKGIASEVEALTGDPPTVPVQTDAVYYFSAPLTSPPPAWGKVTLVEGGDLGTVKFYRQG